MTTQQDVVNAQAVALRQNIAAETAIAAALEAIDWGGGGGGGGGGGTGQFPILARVDTHGHPYPTGACGTSNAADMFPGELDPFAAWRGLPLSKVSLFSNRKGTWDNLTSAVADKGPVYTETHKRNLVVDQTMPLFPMQHGAPNPYKAMRNGDFDKYHAANAKRLASYDSPAIIAMRLCHEWLSGSQQDSPIHDPSGGDDWCAGFTRIGGIYLNTIGPDRCVINLNSIRRPGIEFMKWINGLKEGVAYQVLGCDSYNNAKDGKYVIDEPSWQAYANNHGPDGSPWGILSWFNLAKTKGVMTSVPEWGDTTPTGKSSQADQPYYIKKMDETFNTFSSMMLGESYFNRSDGSTGDHRIFDPKTKGPVQANAKSAVAYRARFAS